MANQCQTIKFFHKSQSAIACEILYFHPSPGLRGNPPNCLKFGAIFRWPGRLGIRRGRLPSTCQAGRRQQDGRPSLKLDAIPYKYKIRNCI